MTIAARPQGLSDVAAGRLDRTDPRRQLRRPPSAADRPRGAGSRPSAAISATTHPACGPAPPRSTCRCSSAGSPAATHGAANTILESNIIGGTCARVCPTEILCEQACVLDAGEGSRWPSAGCNASRPTDDGETGRPTRAAPHRQESRRGRRRAGGTCLRPRLAVAGQRSPSSRPGQGRRPQRIRHRRLQDAGRFRPPGSRLHPFGRRRRGPIRRGARRGREFRRAASQIRCGVPGRGAGQHQRARRSGRETSSRASPTRSPSLPNATGEKWAPPGRPSGRGDRRRQDGGRRGDPGRADRCGACHIVYRRGPRTDERQPV